MVLNNVSLQLAFSIGITFSDLHVNKLDNCVWFILIVGIESPLYEYTIIYWSVSYWWTLKVFDSKNNPALNIFVFVCFVHVWKFLEKMPPDSGFCCIVGYMHLQCNQNITEAQSGCTLTGIGVDTHFLTLLLNPFMLPDLDFCLFLYWPASL